MSAHRLTKLCRKGVHTPPPFVALPRQCPVCALPQVLSPSIVHAEKSGGGGEEDIGRGGHPETAAHAVGCFTYTNGPALCWGVNCLYLNEDGLGGAVPHSLSCLSERR